MRSRIVLPAVLLALAAAAAVTSAVAGARPSGAGADAGVRDRLPALIAFVEQERGLELRREVDVQVLDDEAFVEAFRRDDQGGEPAYDLGATYGALGLADPETFGEDVDAALDEEVVGFYDPVREELVVRQRPLDAYFDLVMVHELTHAVQDQWFKIDRPELFDGTERALAFGAVVEGDASRVERAWYASRSAAERALVDRVEGRAPGEAAYEAALGGGALDSELDFAYVAGLPLVDALLAQGGQERLDAAFRFPPRTSEEVLHPGAPGAGSPVSPPAPRREGEVVDEGVLGERGLALLLELDPLAPGGPQVGWDGDSYRTYEGADGVVCTLATVVMETPAARDRLVAALSELYDAGPSGALSLELESCVEQ